MVGREGWGHAQVGQGRRTGTSHSLLQEGVLAAPGWSLSRPADEGQSVVRRDFGCHLGDVKAGGGLLLDEGLDDAEALAVLEEKVAHDVFDVVPWKII